MTSYRKWHHCGKCKATMHRWRIGAWFCRGWHDYLDVCIFDSLATFSNYSDPSLLRCSCTSTPIFGDGCSCGGGWDIGAY